MTLQAINNFCTNRVNDVTRFGISVVNRGLTKPYYEKNPNTVVAVALTAIAILGIVLIYGAYKVISFLATKDDTSSSASGN